MDAKEMKIYMPVTIECETGCVYSWCRCGQSTDRLFSDEYCSKQCDPINFTVDEDELVTFCRCKATKTPPFCDGSHGQVIMNLRRTGE